MKQILLIDDDPFICDIVTKKFEETDYKIETANSAHAGLQSLEKKMPDLLLLDLGLPDMKGMDVLAQLKANEKFAQLPIIIFSNNDSAVLQKQADDLGADGFFMKDTIDAQKLIEKIGKILWID